MLSYAIYNDKRFFANSPLWKIKCNKNEYTIKDMESFSHTEYDNYIELKWSNKEVSVIVCVFYDDKYEFNIAVTASNDTIDNVVFPIFDDVNSISQNDETAYMLLPYQNGWLIKNPISTILEYKGEIPFWLGRAANYYENEYPAAYSFQFFSYYDENTFGCYFATEDSEAYIKTFGIYSDEKAGLRFATTNYPENMNKTMEYVQPYNFVMSFFNGDWQDSVDIYRKWAINQKWVGKKLIEKGINEKILKSDLWRINHTDYALGTRTKEYLDSCNTLKEKVKANISLHWYGWNMGQHDVNYPEYISRERKSEGWENELTSWIDEIHNSGFNVIPYVNARLWDSTGKLWDERNAKKSAIKDKEQQPLYEPWKGDALKPMCPSSVLWNQTVSDFSQYIQNHNFDGLYVDQVGSYNSTLCFDETHSHPHGGGSWWKHDYTQMMKNLRKKSGKGKIFTTESCCEAYMDVFDLLLVLDTTVAPFLAFKYMNNYNSEPVPLFNMIYGDYGQLYGSCARFSDNIDIFEFNFIRNIIWGLIPTVEGGNMDTLTDETKQPYFEIVKRGIDFYKENKALLTYGRIKKVLSTNCKPIELDFGEIKLDYDTIILTLWENHEGEEFILAYNVSDQEQILDTGEKVEGHTFLKIKVTN